MRKLKFGAFLLVLLGLIAAASGLAAVAKVDYLIFCQAEGQEKVLYLYRTDQALPQTVARGKDITASAGDGWFLYYADHKLYRYDPVQNSSKFLAQLTAAEISAQILPGEAGQALIVAKEDNWINWYVLDMSDGKLRPLERPPAAISGGGSAEVASPNRAFSLRIKVTPFSRRIDLELQKKFLKGNRAQTEIVWRLPKDLTLLPEAPLWAPDSKNLAFYAKKAGEMEGFYSLYLLNADSLQFRQISAQVFNRLLFGSYLSGPYQPSWSHDGGALLFSNQPYGLPTEREIVKYEVNAARKAVVTSGKWNYQYPAWSPSDQWIAVLAEQGVSASQLYIMGPEGENFRRISPGTGRCQWAKWFNDSEP